MKLKNLSLVIFLDLAGKIPRHQHSTLIRYCTTSLHSVLGLVLLSMLYLVGLGLSDETDITVKGLSIVKQASRVYLEAYTSILLVEKEVLVGLCATKNCLS